MTLTLADIGSVVLQVRDHPAFLDTPNRRRVSGDPWNGSVPPSRGKLNAGL